ncbi:MAG: J domain-containing protein [Ramlibacter sp.]
MTHYDTLEISPRASPEVVRAAYRSLMQRFHPDRHPGDDAAAARAAAITEAYDVLSDGAKRATYDDRLADSVARTAPLDAPAWPDGVRRPTPPRSPEPARGGIAWWGLWIAGLAAVVTGAVWLASNRSDPRTELRSARNAFAAHALPEARLRELYARKEVLLLQDPALRLEAAAERSRDLAARTLDLLDAPLVVRLDRYELTIPRMRVVLGTFDAASMRAHIDKHRQRLVQELADQLSRADPVQLAGGGHALLRAVLAGALSKGLGTQPDEDYPSTFFESPGRHGVIEVLLPEGYTLRLS